MPKDFDPLSWVGRFYVVRQALSLMSAICRYNASSVERMSKQLTSFVHRAPSSNYPSFSTDRMGYRPC
jgi:hypothetical protein